MPVSASLTDTEGGVLFASYNIHKCVGTDGRFDPARIGAVIGEISPDVIALQEADRRFGNRAGLLDLDAIHCDTGLVPVQLRHRTDSHGWHGNLVLVREGLLHDLRPVRLPGLEPRGAVVADLNIADGQLRLIAAHLGLLRHSRLMQVEALLRHAAEVADRPVVLMGDFNEWRRRHRSALHPIGNRFSPLDRGVPSFPSYYPMFALDRIIARPRGVVGAVRAHDTPLARVASDHLPVTALVRPGGAARVVEESADAPEQRP